MPANGQAQKKESRARGRTEQTDGQTQKHLAPYPTLERHDGQKDGRADGQTQRINDQRHHPWQSPHGAHPPPRPPAMMRIAVAGGGGLGYLLASQLSQAANAYNVVVLSRFVRLPPPPPGLPPPLSLEAPLQPNSFVVRIA